MLIGRDYEQQRLREAMKSKESEFVAIYGRRRVGKTYLVKEFFGNKITFFHTGLEEKSTRQQLKNFQLTLRHSGMPKAKLPSNWLDAFDMLISLLEASKDKRKIVFIDEIPWMDAPRSGFLSAFGHFWNGWATTRHDVMLIICGSATSWMVSNIINNHGGLHNRVTYNIPLAPFSLHECKLYANHLKLGMNESQILEAYMILGGVPFYWSKLQRSLSLAQNIDQLFFARNGELHNEYNSLYASLFKKPKPYMDIVSTLAKKKVGMTRHELLTATKLKNNGQFTEYLDNLEWCGFIRKYTCIGKKTRDAMYQLMDNFTLFYFQFMQEGINDEHLWSKMNKMPECNTWRGLAFERVCLQHIRQIKQKLGISGIISGEYSWVTPKTKDHPGAQIDLLIDRSDDTITICEMKYSKVLYSVTEQLMEDLDTKGEIFNQVTGNIKSLQYAIVTNKGLTDNSYARDIQGLITTADLFKE